MPDTYDILIAGAGISGTAAAVAAARCGKSVLLVERDYYPGGTAASALVSPMQTFHSPAGRVIGGFAQELVDALVIAGGSLGHLPDPIGFVTTVTPVDAEILKIVLTDFLEKAGVKLILGARLRDVKLAPDGNIACAVLESEDGERREVSARVFIDATGNGDLTYASGVPMETDGDAQPMSLIFRVGHVDAAEIVRYQKAHPEEFYMPPDISVLDRGYIGVSGFFTKVQKARRSGRLKVSRDRLLFFGGVRANEVVINTTRVQGFNALRVEELSAAMLEGISQVHELFEFMRSDIPGFKDAVLLQIAPRIGVRETRRLIGRYRLEEKDLTEGSAFPDVIAKGAFPLDIHSAHTDTIEAVPLGRRGFYDLPLRCLLNDEVNNLITVGKCISVSHRGFSSTRVMPTCLAVGQAGGAAAAILSDAPSSNLEDKTEQLQNILLSQDAIIFDDQILNCNNGSDEKRRRPDSKS
ncbi:MAG: FAD-dependent oxidoreductase [bacterium]